MPESPFSNRELELRFASLETLILTKHSEAMLEIAKVLVQATKTNGTVAALKIGKARMEGAFYIISGLVVLIILPILGWALINSITNSSTIAVLNSKVYTLTHPLK